MGKRKATATADGAPVLSRRTPGKSAELFRERVRPNLINQQDEWFDFDRKARAYMPVEDATIDSELEQFARAAFSTTAIQVGNDQQGTPLYEQRFEPFEPKPNDLRAISDMLKRQNHKPADTMAPPCWLNAFQTPKPRNVISVENGLLDIASGILYESTADFFTRTSLPLAYDPDAPAPTLWLQFLTEVFAGRQELVDLLQEIFGYLVSSDTSQQAIFYLWGVPRSGKSTILRVLTELVGKLNTFNPSISLLGSQFGLWGCMGKSLIKITDMDCDDRAALSRAVNVMNKISGEDDVSFDRKQIQPWTGRLPGRIIMAGNRLPYFGEGAIALSYRLLILPFVVSFAGREDRELTDKLIAELPGILNWALAGLARLRERGRFDEPAVSLEAKTRLLYQSDPVRGLIEEQCVIESGAFIEKRIFYSLYRQFCEANGTHPIALPKLSERLSEIYPTIAATKKRRPSNDSRPPIFSGVRLNDAAAAKVYKIDPDAAALGMDGPHSVLLDADGWPVPRSTDAFLDDYDA